MPENLWFISDFIFPKINDGALPVNLPWQGAAFIGFLRKGY